MEGKYVQTVTISLEPVDAFNHIIMDYLIHDVIEAGFNHVYLLSVRILRMSSKRSLVIKSHGEQL